MPDGYVTGSQEIKQARPFPRVVAELIPALALMAVSLAVMLFTYDKRLNLLDEGFIMTASERLARGEVPYRDFFTLLMPGTFCLHALLFRLFGASLMVGRICTLVLGVLLPMLAYACARLLLPWTFALLAGFLACAWGVAYGWVLPSYSWYASVFAMFSLYLAMKAQTLGWRRNDFLYVGGALGLTFLFKQNFGIFSAVAVGIHILILRGRDFKTSIRDIGLMAGAAALVNLPFILWIAFRGGLADMVRDTVLIPLGPFKADMALPYRIAWPLFPPGGMTWENLLTAGRNAIPAIPLLYPIGLVLTMIRTMRPGGSTDPRSILVAIFASLLILCAFPRADISHIQFPLAPGFILLAFLLHEVSGVVRTRCGKAIGTLVGFSLIMIVGVPLIGSAWKDIKVWNSDCSYGLADVPKAKGIRMQAWEVEPIRQVLDTLRGATSPGESILVVPWASMVYFLSDRVNPTRYDLLIPGNYPPGAEDEMVKALEREKPMHIIHGFVWDVDGKRFQDYLPGLNAFIRSHYVSVGWQGQYEFLRLNGE